jgi:hypothetical protein
MRLRLCLILSTTYYPLSIPLLSHNAMRLSLRLPAVGMALWVYLEYANFFREDTDIFCKIKEKDLTPFIPLYHSRPDPGPT